MLQRSPTPLGFAAVTAAAAARAASASSSLARYRATAASFPARVEVEKEMIWKLTVE